MKITKRQLKQLVKEVVEESRLTEEESGFNSNSFTKDFAKNSLDSGDDVEQQYENLILELAEKVGPSIGELIDEYGLDEEFEEDYVHELLNNYMVNKDDAGIKQSISNYDFGTAVDDSLASLKQWDSYIRRAIG